VLVTGSVRQRAGRAAGRDANTAERRLTSLTAPRYNMSQNGRQMVLLLLLQLHCYCVVNSSGCRRRIHENIITFFNFFGKDYG